MYTWLEFLNAKTMMTIGNIYKMSDLKTLMEKYGAFLSEHYITILFCIILFNTLLLILLHPK